VGQKIETIPIGSELGDWKNDFNVITYRGYDGNEGEKNMAKRKKRKGKLSPRARCMSKELKKAKLKGKSKATRISAFKKASDVCSR